MSQCRAEWDCKCQDVSNNTYYCIRTIDDSENSIFCQFDDDEGFIEAYDLDEDPYQLKNVYLEADDDSKIRRDHIIQSLEDIKIIAQANTDSLMSVEREFSDISIFKYMKQFLFNVINHIGL